MKYSDNIYDMKVACIKGDIDTVKDMVLLCNKDDITNCFYHACFNGQNEIVKFLLDYIDVVEERCIYTAFVSAGYHEDKYLKTIELLFNSGKLGDFDSKSIIIMKKESIYFKEQAQSLLDEYMFRLDGPKYNENIIG
uniref:Ankyrin repeat protein n=1 Tax=viral metagenome TaxID=1070528 RepID=A0A6C0JXB9_9ZZZZ